MLSDWEDVHKELKREFKRRMPSGTAVAARAVDEWTAKHSSDADWIKSHFSQLVEEIQSSAYEFYLRSEANIGQSVIKQIFSAMVSSKDTAGDTVNLFASYFRSLDKFFLGLTQGRRARAGSAFQQIIKEMFKRLGYPFSSQPVINGQPDFLLPSEEYFRQNAIDCIVFTVKRTLRERWRQIVTEGIAGTGFYLATIDEDIATRDIKEMAKSKIFLVLPDRLKKARKDYLKAPNVITFEEFFEYYLDPAMKRWKAKKVI